MNVLVLRRIGVVAVFWGLSIFGPQIIASVWRTGGWHGLLPMLIVLGAAMWFIATDGVRAWRAGIRRPLLLSVIAPTSLFLVSLIIAGIRAIL
jgi:hypothetical protein